MALSGKQNTGKIHGGDELAATKRVLGWNPEESFVVSDEVLEHTRALRVRGARSHATWQEKFSTWAEANPQRKELWDRMNARVLPEDIADSLPVFEAGKDVSTRAVSVQVINALAARLPELWGGSGDLAESNLTTIKDAKSFIPTGWSTREWSGDPYGRVLHFGIREHAMAAIINGIVLHGPTRPYGGTFLIFSDSRRSAVRLAALMNIPSIFVWTHDSVSLVEDGPTHQPIEQLAALRAIPNFTVIRPADANETAVVWLEILRRHAGPTGVALTRQNIPVFARGDGPAYGDELANADAAARVAYVLAEAPGGTPDLILIGTGSEVRLAVQARKQLATEGINARVVSAPSLEWFDEQDRTYRDSMLPPSITDRVSIEAGISLSWRGIVGDRGRSVSIEHFGASADYKTLFQKFGITADAVTQAARETLQEIT